MDDMFENPYADKNPEQENQGSEEQGNSGDQQGWHEQDEPETQANMPQTPPPVSDTGLSKEEKQWGMFCHLSALAIFVLPSFGNILGPLVLWLMKKEEMPNVNKQGKKSLNFQLSVTIYMLCCLPLTCLGGLGIFLAAGIFIANLVFIAMASIAASEGRDYDYPLTIEFIK